MDTSHDKYKEIKDNINNEEYKKKYKVKLNNKIAQKKLENDYHLKILSLSNNINKYVQNEFESNTLQYIYLEKDVDFNFNKIPPRLENFQEKKYQFHIFITLYLNDVSNKKFSYLINSRDQNPLKKKISEYGKIEEIRGSLLDHKVLEKKIGKLLSKFSPENNINNKKKFVQAKISYFHKPDYIIVYDQEEYEFVLNDLNKEVKKILLSNFL